jgi:molybdopterin-biosynthesis enzyme MoeA-like protein
MPGYYLEDRFFFTPGFANMAHPMIIWALDTFYPKAPKSYSCNFIAYTSEAEMIDIMKKLPKQIELSCLPQLLDGKKTAEIHLSSQNQDELNRWCKFFKDELDKLNINYKEI